MKAPRPLKGCSSPPRPLSRLSLSPRPLSGSCSPPRHFTTVTELHEMESHGCLPAMLEAAMWAQAVPPLRGSQAVLFPRVSQTAPPLCSLQVYCATVVGPHGSCVIFGGAQGSCCRDTGVKVSSSRDATSKIHGAETQSSKVPAAETTSSQPFS